MGIYEYSIATDEDGNDYAVETGSDSPGTSEEEIEVEPVRPPAGRRYGRRTLEATRYVSRLPGRRFELYVTDAGLAALDKAWPLFADDAASWTPDQTLEHVDQVLSQQS